MILTTHVILTVVDVVAISSLRTTTFVPNLLLASSNWYCGTTVEFTGKVCMTLDMSLGTERPLEFSALTTKIYEVSGFKSFI